MDRITIVGPGRLGLAFGLALVREEAADEVTVCGRGSEAPPHPLFHEEGVAYVHGLARPEPGSTAVLLTVPDGAIQEVAISLAELGPAPTGCVALHCSGALSADVLAPLHARGYSVGSVHPLQSIAHPVSGADRLEGSAFAVSGERDAVSVGRRLARAVGGWSFSVPVSKRPLYHAAASMASNYTLVLVAAAARLLVEAGAPEEDALNAVLPLVRGTLDNMGDMGPVGALTGPIVRGDAETVRLHLSALPERERGLYTALGRETLKLAAPRLKPEVAEEIHALLEGAEER
jgi:predicted short-subunit dehydrogenase-like oxidoreductase (DUF2520 family)